MSLNLEDRVHILEVGIPRLVARIQALESKLAAAPQGKPQSESSPIDTPPGQRFMGNVSGAAASSSSPAKRACPKCARKCRADDPSTCPCLDNSEPCPECPYCGGTVPAKEQ